MKPTIPHLRLAFWLIAPTVTLWGCSGVSDPGLTEDVRPAYVTAAREASPPSLELVGEVRAAQRAELAFAVAVLDAAPFRATVATSQGEVQRALALQEELRQRLDRLSRAQQAGATRVGETEALQAELNASQAVLSTARAQLALAQWSLEQSQLRAPVAGSIGLRALELGQVVTAGAQVISVDGPGRELSVWLPDWLRLQPGQAVNLMKQGAQPWSTRVLRVGSRQEAGGLVRAYLAAPEQAVVGSTWLMRLQHGSAAKVPHDGTTEIPGRAVLLGLREGQGKVLRLARDGKTVEQVEVQVGQARGEWVQITQGLAQGDTVVVAGAAGIAPGTLVRPMPYPLGARP